MSDPIFLFEKLKHYDLEEVAIEINKKTFFDAEECFWLIKEGNGGIFLTENIPNTEIKGIEKGQLRFLRALNPGDLFFIATERPHEHQGLALFNFTPMKILKLTRGKIDEIIRKEPHLNLEILKLINRTILNYRRLFTKNESFKNNDLLIDFEQPVELEANQRFGIKKNPPRKNLEHEHWMEIIEGRLDLDSSYTLDWDKNIQIYPYLDTWSLKALEKTKLKPLPPEKVLLHPGVWLAFNWIRNRVLESAIDRYFPEKKKLEIETREKKIALKKYSITKGLKSFIPQNKFKKREPLDSKDAIFKVCSWIGQEMGFTFEKHTLPETNPFLEMCEICEKNGVRYREIKLVHGFWSHDCLPIFAFTKEGKPVALLNNKGKKYFLHDPETDEKEPLSNPVIDRLQEKGYIFYIPFPEQNMTIKDILKFSFTGNLKSFCYILFFGTLGGILAATVPFLNQFLFTNVIQLGHKSQYLEVILALFLITISVMTFNIINGLILIRMSTLFSLKVESAIWDRLLKLPVNFFKKYSVGDLIQRASSMKAIQEKFSQSTSNILLTGFFSLFYFFAMYYIYPKLALLGLCIVSAVGAVNSFLLYKKVLIQRKYLELSGFINSIISQVISGISKIRSHGAEAYAFEYWCPFFSKQRLLFSKSLVLTNSVEILINLVPIVSYLIFFGVITKYLISTNDHIRDYIFTIGKLVGFFSAYIPFSVGITNLVQIFMDLAKVIPLWERAQCILKGEIESEKDKIKVDDLEGLVNVDHVTFSYGEGLPNVLDNISLQFLPGEFVALVGASGCGKSTLVRILLGFETPQIGTVFFDNQDIRTLNKRELRRKLGVVLQNGSIFTGTIYQNIVCGGLYSKEDVERAVKLANLEEDLKKMGMGLHTFLQSDALTLSSGEAQRILIARALIGKPRVLILDEASNCLDANSQEILSKNVAELNITRIVIAHRLSTIVNADRIYVMDQGKVVDSGTYTDLMSKEGLFKDLVSQSKKQNSF